jgi:hypothetical protein
MSAADDSGYIGWLRDNSMLAHAERTAGRFSGGRADVAEPVRQPRSGVRGGGVLGVVHRLPDLHDHEGRALVPRHARRRSAVAGVRGHRHRCRAHRSAQTGRWVYLHYFKDGQPSINWLDPTFAGMRLVIGDALHSLGTLGASARPPPAGSPPRTCRRTPR